MTRQGGIATRNRYGNDFFREIGKKRRYYLKGYITRKTKERLREMLTDLGGTKPDPATAMVLRMLAEIQDR
jgi:hypothetical protein